LTTGCAVVTAPKQAPADPVAFFITDYGIHSSLILPENDDGLYVEYAFGDYGYAVLNHDQIWDALGALLVSGKSGFGRQYLRVPPGCSSPMLEYLPSKMTRLTASRAAVDRLRASLDVRYSQSRSRVVHNDITHINWKEDRQHYSLFNNCNQLTAHQLKQLGYGVHGPVFLSHFKLDVGEPISPETIKNPFHKPANSGRPR
jgi:hypothetical protein